MPIIKLGGRLGNQLFQVAFGLAQAHHSCSVLRFDCSDLTEGQLAQLATWIGPIEQASAREIALTQEPPGWSGKAWRLVQRGIPWVLQSSASFQQKVLDPRHQAFFDGYWQSYRYWAGVDGLIRSRIRFQGVLGPSAEAVLRRIESRPSLAIHVRRGDYLGSAGFPVLSTTYFRQAVQAACLGLPAPTIWIFSDDPQWCQENLQLGLAAEVVEGHSPEVDLYLMSRCSSHAIGPSTFGWWGAWLGESLRVVVPELWFPSYSETAALHDVYPESWKILPLGTSEIME